MYVVGDAIFGQGITTSFFTKDKDVNCVQNSNYYDDCIKMNTNMNNRRDIEANRFSQDFQMKRAKYRMIRSSKPKKG